MTSASREIRAAPLISDPDTGQDICDCNDFGPQPQAALEAGGCTVRKISTGRCPYARFDDRGKRPMPLSAALKHSLLQLPWALAKCSLACRRKLSLSRSIPGHAPTARRSHRRTNANAPARASGFSRGSISARRWPWLNRKVAPMMHSAGTQFLITC